MNKLLVVRKPIPGITESAWISYIVSALFPRHEERPVFSVTGNEMTADLLFGTSELRLAVKRMKCGTAPGPDGIPNEALKLVTGGMAGASTRYV